MATGGEIKDGYGLFNVGTLTLEKNTNESPFYTSIVVCQDKIVVIDDNERKLKIHRLNHGEFLASSARLESVLRDMCLMDATTICVLHRDGLITIMSIDSTDMSPVFKTTRTLRLQGVFDEYYGVVRFKNNLVVSGEKQGTMNWCIVSLHDGKFDKINQFCKGYLWSQSYITTKDNIIYISCRAGYKSPDTGVYGFDILNPSQCKYTYKHQRLQRPTSIVINDLWNIYVGNSGNHGDSCIHQLTASCQLVAIFTQGIPPSLNAMFWDNGHLYATCYESHNITVFQPVYQGNHKDSEVETSIEQGRLFQKRVEENLDQARIQMSTEELDSFLRFQHEIGTTLHFSKDPQTSIDVQESLKATEMFLQKSRPDMIDTWLEYKHHGKLTTELIVF